MRDKDGSDFDPEPHPAAEADRRRFRRVAVDLPGRYLLEDGREYPCVCLDVSIGGVRLRATHAGDWGSRVIAYIESIGRLDGHIVRRAPGWFSLQTRVTARKGERVEQRIAWLLESSVESTTDRRRLSRQFVESQEMTLMTIDGRRTVARLSDISNEGAALLTDAPLPVGEPVRLNNRRARVVRRFPGGLAVEFENWADEPRALAVAEPGSRARRA